MTFNPAIPTANQLLSNSQNDLLVNMTALDTSFGVDHYKFSDGTSNNGFHNTVTTPLIIGSAHPATVANIPKFYAMQDSANLGVIQYSRGPNSAAPSPVTILQSPVAAIVLVANTPVTVFDFTGLARAMCLFTAVGTSAISTAVSAYAAYMVFWTGTTLILGTSLSSGGLITATVAGNVLKFQSAIAAGTNAYWSLEFLRTT
jgi:hypothetical protein